MVRNVGDKFDTTRFRREPVHGYDHPAFIEGWEAVSDGTYEYDNPYNAETEHESFSQWRAGWYDKTQAHCIWPRIRK